MEGISDGLGSAEKIGFPRFLNVEQLSGVNTSHAYVLALRYIKLHTWQGSTCWKAATAHR